MKIRPLLVVRFLSLFSVVAIMISGARPCAAAAVSQPQSLARGLTVAQTAGVITNAPVGAVVQLPCDKLRLMLHVEPAHYSKLKMILAARQLGKWDTVKAFIASNGMEDVWQAATYVTPDNSYFISATNACVQQGFATDAEIKTFLSNCVGD